MVTLSAAAGDTTCGRGLLQRGAGDRKNALPCRHGREGVVFPEGVERSPYSQACRALCILTSGASDGVPNGDTGACNTPRRRPAAPHTPRAAGPQPPGLDTPRRAAERRRREPDRPARLRQWRPGLPRGWAAAGPEWQRPSLPEKYTTRDCGAYVAYGSPPSFSFNALMGFRGLMFHHGPRSAPPD